MIIFYINQYLLTEPSPTGTEKFLQKLLESVMWVKVVAYVKIKNYILQRVFKIVCLAYLNNDLMISRGTMIS